jgi:AAA+ ATPase superfamily predicted ATPase
MFYGREIELEFLKKKLNSKKSELIIIYGRRRIGKTELLKYFSKDVLGHNFYVAKECTDKEQLESFSKNIITTNNTPYIDTFKDWETALIYLMDRKTDFKKLLIIDEFPYIVHSNKVIPSVIQNIWDHNYKNSNIVIILCGSAMSFIEKEILSEKAPLFGRATGIYKLTEMNYLTASQFFENTNYEVLIMIYCILGGIPHYLDQFDSESTLEENIKTNILRKGCTLYSEVEFLIKQELRETSRYYTIIEAVAFGNTKLNDIYTKTQIDARKISVYLNNLIELNIIEREYPIDFKTKKKINAQSGLYKLKDNFFRFYFRFIFPNLSLLEIGDVDIAYDKIISPEINAFVSIPFEDICIQYLKIKNKSLPIQFTHIGRWWNKTDEIDIVAMYMNKVVIVGECKWKVSKMSLHDYNKLIEKLQFIKADLKDVHIYLFSKSGFEKSLTDLAEINEKMHIISIEELFN